MNKEIRDFSKDFIMIICIALILSVGLRTWVIEGRIVPSGSMLPTIQLKDRLMVNKFIYLFKDPQKGDIIIFHPPDQIGTHDDYVKRVVAVPEDTVEVKDGRLFINGLAQNEPYIKEAMNYNFGPVTVPADSYFVMGDNRNESFDSHLWGVWLTRDHIIGKAFIIYWPADHMQLLKR